MVGRAHGARPDVVPGDGGPGPGGGRRRLRGRPRLWGRCGALALAWALLTALPVSLDLPYAVTLALQLVTSAAALWIAVRPGPLTRGLRAPGAPEPEREPEASAGAATPWTSWAPRRTGAGTPAVEAGGRPRVVRVQPAVSPPP